MNRPARCMIVVPLLSMFTATSLSALGACYYPYPNGAWSPPMGPNYCGY